MSEGDTRSAVLCRSGVTFVDKMDQFISGSSICKGLGELARCFLYHVRSHANLVHTQILGVCRSFDRPMPGPFPASPQKPGKSALRTRLSELHHFMQSPSGWDPREHSKALHLQRKALSITQLNICTSDWTGFKLLFPNFMSLKYAKITHKILTNTDINNKKHQKMLLNKD